MAAQEKPNSTSGNQRDALAESEKKASEKQPRSYDERNETEKKVHINPPDPNSDNAIKGIDPKQ
jgi:hypothetical protein